METAETAVGSAPTAVVGLIASLQTGERPTLRNSLTADSTWSLHGRLPVAGLRRGPSSSVDELLAPSTPLLETGPVSLTVTVTVTVTVAQAENVSVEYVVEGKAAANGLPYKNYHNIMFEAVGDRVHRVRDYIDTLHALDTLDEAPAGRHPGRPWGL